MRHPRSLCLLLLAARALAKPPLMDERDARPDHVANGKHKQLQHQHAGERRAEKKAQRALHSNHTAPGPGALLHDEPVSAITLQNTAIQLEMLMGLSHRIPFLRTRDNLLKVATKFANQRDELMFTTVTMDSKRYQQVFLRQWLGNLRESAVHAMVIGTDELTCAVARNASVPCFVDALAPKLSGKQNHFGPQVLFKWWYASTLLELGFHAIFSDPDIAWLRPPFEEWRAAERRNLDAFDLQGLSDIRSTNLTLQPHHEITCIRGWMDGMYEHGRRSIYPCQSTGLWYLRNTEPSRSFISSIYDYLTSHPNEWEQKAFQLIVMRYLVGIGDELAPLRYRLLPTSRFINVEFYEQRVSDALDVSSMTAVHCGYLITPADKFEHLELTGFLERGLSWHHRLTQVLAGTPAEQTSGNGSRTRFFSGMKKNRKVYQTFLR